MSSHLSKIDTFFSTTMPNFVDDKVLPFMLPIMSKIVFPTLGFVTNMATSMFVLNMPISNKKLFTSDDASYHTPIYHSVFDLTLNY